MFARLLLVLVGLAVGLPAFSQGSQPDIFIADYGTANIWRVSPGGGKTQILTSSANIRGLAVDAAAARIYFLEYDPNQLSVVDFDGGNRTAAFGTAPGTYAINLDVPNGKVYWSGAIQAFGGTIFRANLDGSSLETIPVPTHTLNGIAHDPVNGKIYWVNRGTAFFGSDGTIARANLDGSGAEILVTGLFDPNTIALDVPGGHMYWTQGYQGLGRIMRAGLDGSNPTAIVTGLDSPSGFTLDLVAQKMYWTLEGQGAAGRANMDGTGVETFVTGLSRPVSIAVARAAPLAELTLAPGGPSDPIALGTAVTVSASYAEVGSGTPACTIDWGDPQYEDAVSGTMSNDGGIWTCTGTHTYSEAGVYSPILAIADPFAAATSVAYDFVVVYDAAGGFVTGGGWIQSPLGAYPASPGTVGKATFGFVSRYQRGAQVPSGNTQFQFQAAGFEFRATAYDWLVVAGSRAQYKGSGSVNGASGFAFMLTAHDGQSGGGSAPDAMRIKIWEKATGIVVYDNAAGADDLNGSGATALAGGSVTLHR